MMCNVRGIKYFKKSSFKAISIPGKLKFKPVCLSGRNFIELLLQGLLLTVYALQMHSNKVSKNE